MNEQFIRTIALIGENNFNNIQNKTIAVFGLGGVGGTTFESLVRTGFKNFIIVDFDVVDVSNLNRQILYTLEDINKLKVEASKQRALKINPNLKIDAFNLKISANSISNFKNLKIDYIIDAIDDLPGKVEIIKFSLENNIPFISSLGMANKLNSTDVTITKLNKTTTDPLAKKLRYMLKKENVEIGKVMVAFSSEYPVRKERILSSIMMVPSAAGLAISSYVLKVFLEENRNEEHL